MRVLSVFVLAGVAMAQGPAYHEVANNRQIMQGLIQPAQQAISAAAKETGPADDRAWRGVALNAVILQESAELLKTSGRAKDQDAWVKDADALAAAGVSGAESRRSKGLRGPPVRRRRHGRHLPGLPLRLPPARQSAEKAIAGSPPAVAF